MPEPVARTAELIVPSAEPAVPAVRLAEVELSRRPAENERFRGVDNSLGPGGAGHLPMRVGEVRRVPDFDQNSGFLGETRGDAHHVGLSEGKMLTGVN